MELARLGRWLDRVAYHPLTSVDTRWLAVARVMIAGIFLVDLATRAYLSPLLTSKPSPLSDAVGRTFAMTSLPSVALGIDSAAGMQAYFGCAALAGFLFLLGFVTKPAGVALLVLQMGLVFRHPAAIDAAGCFGLAALAWVLVSPCGMRGSVDAWTAGRAGRWGPSRVQTTWAWVAPVGILACCLTSGRLDEAIRLPFGDGASIGVAVREGIELSVLGDAALLWSESQIYSLSGVLHGLALVGAVSLFCPWQVGIVRKVGGALLLVSALVSSLVVPTCVMWWTMIAVVAGLQHGGEDPAKERSRAPRDSVTERRARLLVRECAGLALTLGLVAMMVGAAAGQRAPVDSRSPPQRWTSQEDAQRGALLRVDRSARLVSVAVGPWPHLEVVTARVSLFGTTAAGVRHRWRDAAWQELDEGKREQPAPPTAGLVEPIGLRGRREQTALARLYEHLYTYGAIELERMVWSGQDRGSSCEGGVQDATCIETIELREYRRTKSTSLELGDGRVVYTGTRDSPERVALVPREDLAR